MSKPQYNTLEGQPSIRTCMECGTLVHVVDITDHDRLHEDTPDAAVQPSRDDLAPQHWHTCEDCGASYRDDAGHACTDAVDIGEGYWHVYLHHADETLTLIAAGTYDDVTTGAGAWLYLHDIPEGSHLVLAAVAQSVPVPSALNGAR